MAQIHPIQAKSRGFTLIELITVVAIIAILAGILFPVISSAIDRGKAARTAALINKIDAALYKYNSDCRDFPKLVGTTGGTLADNNDLYLWLIGRDVDGTMSPMYIEFNDKETAVVNGTACLVDGWGYPLLYHHFTDYDDDWSSNQPWRADRKKFEFQVVGAGSIREVDGNNDGVIEPDDLNGLNAKQKGKLVKNW